MTHLLKDRNYSEKSESFFDESSNAFEQDSEILDEKISIMEEEISKSLTEIAKIFETKYRDLVPAFMILLDCQDKIQSTLKTGDRKLKKVQDALINLETNILEASEDAPHKKLDIIVDFIERLKVLSEIENCLNSIWSNNAANGADNLNLANVILRLEELVKTLENENDSESVEAINDRILPLVLNECASRKGELLMILDSFYKDFIKFPAIENNATSTEMLIKCFGNKTLSDNLTALKKLNDFEERLDTFVDSIFRLFCKKIVHNSVSTESIFTYRPSKEFNAPHKFSITNLATVSSHNKSNPQLVFSTLETFFESLYHSLVNIEVNSCSFVKLIGEKLAPQIINLLIKDCLIKAIPVDKKDPKIYENLVNLSTHFHDLMKKYDFFSNETINFDSFTTDWDRIFVDRQCYTYIKMARELIIQPYIHLTEVGSADDEEEEKVGDIAKMIEEKLKLSEQDFLALSRSTNSDKFFTKLFQFQKCKISTSTFKFVHLLQDALSAALDTNSEMESARLFVTVRNLIEIFVAEAPKHHQQALTTVPQIAGVFFNNCHYICHRLVTIQADVFQNSVLISNNQCNFVEYFTELRNMAANTLEQHLIQVRRQLSTTFGSGDIFVNLRDEESYKKCERVIMSCSMQIGQIAEIFREVMSEFVFTQTLGSLISHLLNIVSDIILSKEDIAANDAKILVLLISKLIEKMTKCLTINNYEVIHRVCEGSYYKINEILFCLDANLAEIGHRWCEGKGPLAVWLKASHVKQLVRALFQNTDRRAQLLAQIN